MLKSLYIMSLLLSTAISNSARHNISCQQDFPVPPHTSRTLFYIQRSPNTNTIMYEVNVRADKTIDPDNPVEVYWLRYADKGEKKGLNFIEQRIAYGVNCTALGNGYYTMNFVASKKKTVKIYIDKTGQAQAEMAISNTASHLEKIFITVTDNDVFPKVLYVEFFGTDLTSGKKSYEKMII